MKPLVVYHANCADGFGAAFAAWLKLGESDSIEEGAEYVPMQYGTVPDIESWHMQYAISQREVYILDFSFPRQTMDYLFSVARRVTWLDHHKSAFEMWCGEISEGGSWCEDTNFMQGQHMITLDNNKSGAILTWEYFHPGEEIPQFIRHIDDYDRWQFKIEGTKAFNKALWSYAPWSFKQWQHEWDSTWGYSSADGLEGMPNFIQEGTAILRAHDQNVQSVVKGSSRDVWIKADKPIDLPGSFLDGVTQGWQGLAANCPPHLTSDVGHELANQSGTFGLCWTLSQTDLVAKCSLRSNGDYDVSAIAKAFGGGGHRNAAGFEVPIQTLLGWLK